MKKMVLQLVFFIAFVPLGGLVLMRFFESKGSFALNPVVSEKLGDFVSDLQKSNPDYIVIGDSMVYTRMNSDELSTISGKRFYFYSIGGTSSAAWYLYLKQVIVPARVKPRAVIFFFRDQFLTWPRDRVDGLNHLDRLKFTADKLVTEMLLPDPPSPWNLLAWTRRFLVEPGGLFYSKTASSKFQSRIENLAMDATALGEKKDIRKLYMHDRFDVKFLRSDLSVKASEMDSANMDPNNDCPTVFNPSPDKSFLPHIISLTRKTGIEPVFFRVKRRPDKNNLTLQNPELTKYIQDLAVWLKSQNCIYFDETSDPSITLPMYNDGDHLKEQYKPWWTNYFWQRMKGSLP